MAKLQKGISYYLQVESIDQIKGPFGPESNYYVHMTFFDHAGHAYKAEYETTDPRQEFFLVGKKQRFYVDEVQAHGIMIMPLPNSTQTEEQRPYTDNLIVGKGALPIAPQNIRPVAGESYSVAMVHAANIFVGLTGCAGVEQYEKHKELLFVIAEDIDQWLLQKQAGRQR